MFNVSIVLYKTSIEDVLSLIHSILSAQNLHCLYIIDNSPTNEFGQKLNCESLVKDTHKDIKYMYLDGKNIGYGSAHNIAIRESIYQSIPFHLVMNTDILLDSTILDELFSFLQENPQVGQVIPKVLDEQGDFQSVYKALPNPFSLFARRFLPDFVSDWTNKRYELRHLDRTKMINAPYLSGCFMFFRTEALLKARLFDERYFLYAEDIDITRTIHRDYLTVYLPYLSIRHKHTRASYHSYKMLFIHIINVCRYFNKWGWIFDKERDMVNKITYQQQDLSST